MFPLYPIYYKERPHACVAVIALRYHVGCMLTIWNKLEIRHAIVFPLLSIHDEVMVVPPVIAIALIASTEFNFPGTEPGNVGHMQSVRTDYQRTCRGILTISAGKY